MADTPANPWRPPSSEASRAWARHGHASSRLEPVITVRPDAPATRRPGRRVMSRTARRAVGTTTLLVVLTVSAGSALAFHDVLFPDVGDSTTQSIWQNPGRPDESASVPALAGASMSTISASSTTAPTPSIVLLEIPPVSTETSSSPPSSSAGAADVSPSSTTDRSTGASTTSVASVGPSSTGVAAAGNGGAAATSSSATSTTSPTSDDRSAVSTTIASVPTTAGGGGSSSTSVPSSSTTKPEETSTTEAGSSTTTAQQPTAPFTSTYSSAGGSITVTWNGTRLSLDAVAPAAGYVAAIDANSDTRIRVEFDGDAGTTRIEVRADNGQVRVSNG